MFLKNANCKFNERHPFHLVAPSPWPFLIANATFLFLITAVSWFHGILQSITYHPTWYLFWLAVIVLYFLYRWFLDIITESTFEGHHTIKVTKGLRLGMVLFIISEIMFFFFFFFGHFFILACLLVSELVEFDLPKIFLF